MSGEDNRDGFNFDFDKTKDTGDKADREFLNLGFSIDEFLNLETIEEVNDTLDVSGPLDDNTKSSAENKLKGMGFEIPKDDVLLNEALSRLFFAVGIHSDFNRDMRNIISRMKFHLDFEENMSLQDRAYAILGDCLSHYINKIENNIDLLKGLSSQHQFSESVHTWRDQALTQIRASAANEEAMSFSVQSLELLRNYCDNGLEVDYDAILREIIISNPDKAIEIRQNTVKYQQILEATANIYVSCMNRAEKERERAANLSDNTTTVLDKELENLKKMKEAYTNHSLDFIRQVHEIDECFYVKCPKCGEMHEVKSLFTLYLVGDINSPELTFVPTMISCGCGVSYIISCYDLIVLRLNLAHTEFKDLVGNVWKNASKNMQSGCICRYKLSLLKTKPYLPRTLFFETNEIIIKEDRVTDKEVEHEEIIFSNMREYEDALDLLYSTVSHLPSDSEMVYAGLSRVYDGFSVVQDAIKPKTDFFDMNIEKKEKLYYELQNKSHNSTLVQSILAVHVAKILGKEYKILKNRAILSLLYSIQSSKLVNVLTDCERYNQYYAHLQTLITCSQYSKNNLPVDLRTELINLYAIYGSTIDTSASDDVLCSVAMSSIDLLIATLDKRITKIEEDVNWVKDTLYAMSDIVSYTKILNINTSRLDSLAIFLDDAQFSRYCNEIADKMIITNYVERTLSKSVVSKLESADDATTLYDLCGRLLKSQIGDYPSRKEPGTCARYCESFVEEYFNLLQDTSLLGCSVLGDVYDALKEFNLFSATKLVAENEFDLSQFDEKYEGSLGQKIRTSLERVKKFYEEHLANKTESTFYYEIAGFQDNDVITTEYNFDYQFILRRKSNESLEAYINRLNQGEGNGKSFIHTSDYFTDILKDLYIIQLAGTILRTEIKSFIKTSYAVSLYNLLCEELNVGSTCDVLGIKPQVYQEYLLEAYEVDLFFKDGKHYPSLDEYTANQELTLALAMLSEKYNATLFVNQRDDIQLSNVIQDLLEEFSSIIISFEERNIPLGVLSTKDNEIPIVDYSAQELISDLERFLGKKK